MRPVRCRRPYAAPMAGRREDSTPDHPADAGPRSQTPDRRRRWRAAGLVVGLLLAAGGTAAVLYTDDARHLRVALLATCWAFLVAAFLAGGRRGDQVAAEGREAELRHAYDLELEREVAARKAHELELERRLRREAEDGMRRELAGLRADLAGLSGLRDDLSALGELRADLGRLRTELTEQLSGELLIERMVMRAQAVRLPADRSPDDDRRLDGATATLGPRSSTWEHATVERRPDSREEIAGSRALAAPTPPVEASPAPRPAATPTPTSTRRLARVDDDVRAETPAAPPPLPADPSALDGVGSPAEAPVAVAEPGPTPRPPAPEPVRPERLPAEPPAAERPLPVPGPGTAGRPTPAPRSRYRVGLDAPPPGEPAPRRHRRAAEPDDERTPGGSTRIDSRTAEEPAVAAPVARLADGPVWSWSPDVGPAPPAAAPAAPADAHASGHARLEQILADSGVDPAPGRRRRRYRDDDGPQPDDVLARVLGRQ